MTTANLKASDSLAMAEADCRHPAIFRLPTSRLLTRCPKGINRSGFCEAHGTGLRPRIADASPRASLTRPVYPAL